MSRIAPSSSSSPTYLRRAPRGGLGALACAAAIGAGCAHVDPRDGFATVGGLVAERSPHTVTWQRSEAERVAIAAEVDLRLAAPLEPASAVEVSLLLHPRIQALYEEIGVSAAAVVEAATVENPVLSAEAFWPGGGGTLLETSLAQNLLSLVTRPARKRLAETQYRRAQLAVAAEVLDHAAAVESAYWELVAAEHAVELRGTIASAAEAAAELAARMRAAGTASELDAGRERALHETTLLALRRAEGARVAAREHLARLLGLESAQAAAFTTPLRLPDLPAEEPPLDGLELQAIEERLDLAAAGQEVEALAQALGITRKWRWFVLAELGVEADRELDGEWLVGPKVELQLPIFDQRRGELQRREAELRQAEHRLRALALDIRSHVREERAQVLLARDLVRRYREEVIPLRERVVALLQERYDFMVAGAFELLEARREEFESYEDYLHAVRDYYVARARLARAVGGRLPAPGPPSAEPAPAAPPPAHDHGTGGAS